MSCQAASSVTRDPDFMQAQIGEILVPVNPTAKEAPMSERRTDEKVGRARAWGGSERLFGEYRLHLCLVKSICGTHIFEHPKTYTCTNVPQWPVYCVLIKMVLETHPYYLSISLSMQYSRSSNVFIHFNSVHITLLSLICLFQDIPLGAQEVTGDSWGRKRK